MTILIGGEERGFSRMLHQVVVNKADAGDSPASAARSWSPSGIYGGGNRVVPTTEVAATGVAMKVNKVLQNGDVYCGEFADGTPHGRGKYLWADGCVYEGEWRNGKAAGKGKFSWPSSATFEGEFKDGRMEGYGIFIGANGETYHGSWMADRKHGCGKKSYENGDFYEGQWRKDLQEGHGRYFWRNGNQYIGEWHKGVISGRGVLVCANGSLYDGQWEKGVPKKCGVFTWPDSCFYTGSWNRDPHSQQQASNLNATPISRTTSRRSSISSFGESPSRLLPSKNRFSVDGRPARNSTAVKNSQLIWEFRGAAGDITCDIVGNIEPSLHYRDDSELCKREIENQLQQRSHCCLSPREAKMLGETISKGHKNYELVLNLQSGIRYSVGKPSSEQPTELRPSDFDPKEKYWTRFPLEGSKLTPPPHSTNFRWKDYCPNVFRHLRKVFSLDPLDYTKAICGDESLRELSSPGKSGSLFYLTQDGRFIIKIVKKCEVKVLIKMLLSYYQHVCKYEDSLVSRFFGAHCVKPSGGHKVRFIVMGNLFFPESRIHRRFDLKGSSHGRTIRKTEEKVDENTTLKDLDLDLIFYIQKTWFKKLIWQLERDCEFLEAESIMDYSLLVGIHFCDDDFSASKMGMVAASQKLADLHKSFHGNGPLIELSFPELGWQDTARFMDGRKPPVRRLGTNMPARAQYVGVGGGPMVQPPSSQPHKVVLYFGIIDILQDYDIGKKLEHVYKSLHVDSTSISAVDPKLYSARFHDFVGKIFIEDD